MSGREGKGLQETKSDLGNERILPDEQTVQLPGDMFIFPDVSKFFVLVIVACRAKIDGHSKNLGCVVVLVSVVKSLVLHAPSGSEYECRIYRQRNPALTRNSCVDTLVRLKIVLEREVRVQLTCAVICSVVYMPRGDSVFPQISTLSMSSTAARCTSLWVSSLRWT